MPSCISSGRASSSGGLVGYNNWGTIRDVYATGMIHSSGDDSDSGGLVGYSDRSAIHDTYALGSIYSNSDAYATGATRCAGSDCPAGGVDRHPSDPNWRYHSYLYD